MTISVDVDEEISVQVDTSTGWDVVVSSCFSSVSLLVGWVTVTTRGTGVSLDSIAIGCCSEDVPFALAMPKANGVGWINNARQVTTANVHVHDIVHAYLSNQGLQKKKMKMFRVIVMKSNKHRSVYCANRRKKVKHCDPTPCFRR
jgi:hypothetical protein